ncbi:MAG: SIR2 family NAD-dependent protein deacylase [Planctomycetota bacterium]|jgi:NAD-dependent deacetylase
MDFIDEAASLLGPCRRIVAFTGAGISAESGIPTYRGQGGLWGKYDPAKYASIDYFMKDPAYYWGFFRDLRVPILREARPNPAHLALARLEEEGRLAGVITQNIDGLHQEGGSKKVIELHGNSRFVACLGCGQVYGMEAIYEQLTEGGRKVPECGQCDGMLMTTVVLFGESLPPDALREAAALVSACDALMAVGSSLLVYPAALFPEQAAARGAKFLIVNAEPTPMDAIADLSVQVKAGEFLPLLVDRLCE